MKFKALKAVYGDYGRIRPGEEFEVPDFRVHEMATLEANGTIMRVMPRPVRYTVVVKDQQAK